MPPRTDRTAWTSTTRGLAAVSAAAGLLVGAAAGGVVHAVTTSGPSPVTVAVPPPAPAPAPSTGGAPANTPAIVSAVTPSIVDIATRLDYQNAAGAGTGMVLTSTGEVLTNNHVVEGATRITVTLVSTGRSYPARVLGTDPTDDIAVLKIDATGLTPIRPDTGLPNPGDRIVALGNALGRGGAPAVTGTVTALNRPITVTDDSGNGHHLTGLIETSAPLQPGDSGGPLVDTQARVIGMNTATSVGRRAVVAPDSYAIPMGRVLSVARQVERGESSATVHLGYPGFLGVDLATNATGAVVADVVPGGPADRAGVSAGDTITAVAGNPVASADALVTAIHAHRPNDVVTVDWTTADGTSRRADVKLTTGPPD